MRRLGRPRILYSIPEYEEESLMNAPQSEIGICSHDRGKERKREDGRRYIGQHRSSALVNAQTRKPAAKVDFL